MNALARYLFGLAAVAFGICTLVYHSFPNWVVIKSLGDATYQASVTDLVGVIGVLGGVAILWLRTARIGALAIGGLYLVIALVGIRLIVAQPTTYNGYGNFFEQGSFVCGAAILYGLLAPDSSGRQATFARIGYYGFGICVLSFGLEQLFYLTDTAGFVPKWIPLGQMFWAIATTVAFGAAALALLTRFKAVLASQLNTAMLIGFGLLVWAPALIADAHSFVNWSETIETFGIAASSWIVTVYLARSQTSTSPSK
jgi:hypothetical protein